jgi:hypothetical protein
LLDLVLQMRQVRFQFLNITGVYIGHARESALEAGQSRAKAAQIAGLGKDAGRNGLVDRI